MADAGQGASIDPLAIIREGAPIPANPLALDAERRLDMLRQRALTRYYIDAGAGGLAVAPSVMPMKIKKIDAGSLSKGSQNGQSFQQWLTPHPGRDAGFTLRSPDRSEHALLTHSAPTSGV